MGMTQIQLGSRVGVSDAAITQYEGGRNLPRLRRLEAIAEVLGVTTEWLLTGGEPEEIVKAQTVSERLALELIRSMSEEQQATALAVLSAIRANPTKPG